MDKVAIWEGMTQTHGFHIEVSRDPATGEFVARLETSSPPLIPEYIAGTPMPMMHVDRQEELRHEELDQLRELTKQHIISRCGKILQFDVRLSS